MKLNFLIMFHTPVNAGYAMAPLERTFFEVALSLTSEDNIYFSFAEYSGEVVKSLPSHFTNILEINANKLSDLDYFNSKKKFLKDNSIDLALCFDLQVSGPAVELLRSGGVKKIASYWGSTISGINSGLKLRLKKLEVSLNRKKPDLFIFESKAMQKHAVFGRGIKKRHTTVIPTGVDTDKLKPRASSIDLEVLGVPHGSNVAIYSGHMEARKGVHVLIKAFQELVETHDNKNWHLLICGNRPGEDTPFLKMVEDSDAIRNIHFLGYRTDLPELMPACDVGVIGSTGWDSFPMSALEMASCGLPIIASDLQGLSETVEHEKTGLLFKSGDHEALAVIINNLTNDTEKLAQMSNRARERIVTKYSLDTQKTSLKLALSEL